MQWARTVLIVERGIPPAERLRQQDLYSERNSTGKKVMVMKQFLSAEKLEEIEEIIEMKITHRKGLHNNLDGNISYFQFQTNYNIVSSVLSFQFSLTTSTTIDVYVVFSPRILTGARISSATPASARWDFPWPAQTLFKTRTRKIHLGTTLEGTSSPSMIWTLRKWHQEDQKEIFHFRIFVVVLFL